MASSGAREADFTWRPEVLGAPADAGRSAAKRSPMRSTGP